MPESSEKISSVSRRQPVQRRQRPRTTLKAGQKKANVKPQPSVAVNTEATALTRLNQHNSPTTNLSGGRRQQSGLVMPTAVKPIPKLKGKVPPIPSKPLKIKTVRVPKQLPMDRRSRKARLKPMARTILYGLRLLIVGVGMGAIVGTLLSVFDPANRVTPSANQVASNPSTTQSQNNPNPQSGSPGLYLSQEMLPLKTELQTLASTNPNLTPGVFMVDLDTGAYVDINSTGSFPAASTIKVPILIAFFQDVDAGKIRMDEMLTLQQNAIAGGSGNLQYKAVGTQYNALDVATKMITISDNTAANMLINRLGGIEALNERFRTWGLVSTVIRNRLPDLSGTNTTSPKELGNLMAMVSQGWNIVSPRSRDLMLDIMRRTERDTLLPSGLGTGARISHKTGDIGTMLADAGLVDAPNGKRYIASVMVKRPNNDPRAEKFISSISSVAYKQMTQNPVTPTTPPSMMPPINGYQPGYQPQIMNPPVVPIVPNGTMNTMPMTGYPAPMIDPQAYPPR